MKENEENDRRDRIDWHAAFAGGFELGLRRYRDSISVERNYPLSKEPLEMDYLVIKLDKKVQIDNAIGRIFRKHNIKKNASEEDVRSFLEETKTFTDLDNKHDAEAVLVVSSTVNQELFEKLRGEDKMRSVFQEIVDEMLIEKEEKGIEKGIEIGIEIFIEDKIEDGISEADIIEKLQKRFELSKEKAKEYYDKYAGNLSMA